jgi:cell wall assembly regulator SMI1
MSRNGGIFQDKGGNWWMIFFGNDGSGPWWQRPGLVPLQITDVGNEIVIDLKMPPYTDYELRVMGGGQIAEVKTVPDSISEQCKLK